MISVAVMAHPSRAEWVPELVDRLDVSPKVVWDEGWNDRHITGLHALQAYDPQASHHLIVQDDAKVCRDLVAGVAKAVQHTGDHPLGLYTGRVRPFRGKVTEAVKKARHAKAPWIEMEGPWWGVGIVIPTRHLPQLCSWYEASDETNYDRRIAYWYRRQGIRCWYSVPSLVDHRTDGNPSLVPGRTSTSRCAQWFIGEDASALDVDWRTDPAVAEGYDGWLEFRDLSTGAVTMAKEGSASAEHRQASSRWVLETAGG